MPKNDCDAWRPSCTIEILKKRAWMLSVIRQFFQKREILEVETPCLCQTTGTELNLSFFSTQLFGLDPHQDKAFYLQTSPEFAMKRLIAAGSGPIYQITKAFRNGESGRFHNPEFTILEWYRIGSDLDQLMTDVGDLIDQLFSVSMAASLPRERLSYQEAFAKHTGIDILQDSVDLNQVAYLQGLDEAKRICGDDKSVWLDFLFSHLVQPNLGKNAVTFIYDYPACQAGLARIDTNKPEVAKRMEIFVDGVELGNGYHELIDPEEQAKRFRSELDQRAKQGRPMPKLDTRLLISMKHGIPDCSGIAVGLDRLLMLLCGLSHIDEVLAFPIARA